MQGLILRWQALYCLGHLFSFKCWATSKKQHVGYFPCFQILNKEHQTLYLFLVSAPMIPTIWVLSSACAESSVSVGSDRRWSQALGSSAVGLTVLSVCRSQHPYFLVMSVEVQVCFLTSVDNIAGFIIGSCLRQELFLPNHSV